MAQLKVTNSLKIGGKELKDIAEISNSNDIRQKVNLNNQHKLNIAIPGYNQSFVIPYNYSINKNKADYYQKAHIIEIANNLILSEKGTRPLLNSNLDNLFIAPGVYTLSYNNENNNIIIKKPDNSIKTLVNKKIIYLLASGAGGGGGRAAGYYGLTFLYSAHGACGGGSGAYALLMLDMVKLKEVKIYIGAGGKRGDSSSGSSDGEPSIIFSDKAYAITLGGGKRGIGESVENNNGGEGGKVTFNITAVEAETNKNNFNLLKTGNGWQGGGKNTFEKDEFGFMSCSGSGSLVTFYPGYSEVKLEVKKYGGNSAGNKDAYSRIGGGGAASIFEAGGDAGNYQKPSPKGKNGSCGAGGGGAVFDDQRDGAIFRDEYVEGGSGGNGAFQIFY